MLLRIKFIIEHNVFYKYPLNHIIRMNVMIRTSHNNVMFYIFILNGTERVVFPVVIIIYLLCVHVVTKFWSRKFASIINVESWFLVEKFNLFGI